MGGAYASLELAARWPGAFAAVAPVASMYEIDPVESLIWRLSAPHPVPCWFVHAKNDLTCPIAPVEALVQALKPSTSAEVRLTAYDDTWSTNGHCADRVAYGALIDGAEEKVAWGEELFVWLAAQRGPGKPFLHHEG